MKLSKLKLKLFIISLLFLSCNSYGAYINQHYEEKVEEKFVSESMNSNTVVACFVRYEDFFMMNKPSLHDTLENCKENKMIVEKLNRTKYKFGKIKGYLPYSKEVIVELIEVKRKEWIMESIKLEDVKSVLESRMFDILKEIHNGYFDDDWMYQRDSTDRYYLEGRINSLIEVYEELFGIDAYLEFQKEAFKKIREECNETSE